MTVSARHAIVALGIAVLVTLLALPWAFSTDDGTFFGTTFSVVGCMREVELLVLAMASIGAGIYGLAALWDRNPKLRIGRDRDFPTARTVRR